MISPGFTAKPGNPVDRRAMQEAPNTLVLMEFLMDLE
jgi:hypothetical protein